MSPAQQLQLISAPSSLTHSLDSAIDSLQAAILIPFPCPNFNNYNTLQMVMQLLVAFVYVWSEYKQTLTKFGRHLRSSDSLWLRKLGKEASSIWK